MCVFTFLCVRLKAGVIKVFVNAFYKSGFGFPTLFTLQLLFLLSMAMIRDDLHN